MISLQDYHILEGKYKQLQKDYAQSEATMSIKDKMLKELDDTITTLKRENYVMNGLLNGKEKEIVEDLQKLKNMQDECDTCMKQEFELNRLEQENAALRVTFDNKNLAIEKLEQENATLHAKLTANRFIYNTNERHKYQDKIEDLQLQRDVQSITIKQLNDENIELRQKVKPILGVEE